MSGDLIATSSLDLVAHIIQLALTPIFLLSGIAALLNVFSSRLARVADRVDRITELLRAATNEEAAYLGLQLAYLRRRSRTLDIAVVIAALGGVATCSAALTLFVGALRNKTAGTILFALFGFGLFCTIGALTAFVCEMLMASRGLRARSTHSDRHHDEIDDRL